MFSRILFNEVMKNDCKRRILEMKDNYNHISLQNDLGIDSADLIKEAFGREIQDKFPKKGDSLNNVLAWLERTLEKTLFMDINKVESMVKNNTPHFEKMASRFNLSSKNKQSITSDNHRTFVDMYDIGECAHHLLGIDLCASFLDTLDLGLSNKNTKYYFETKSYILLLSLLFAYNAVLCSYKNAKLNHLLKQNVLKLNYLLYVYELHVFNRLGTSEHNLDPYLKNMHKTICTEFTTFLDQFDPYRLDMQISPGHLQSTLNIRLWNGEIIYDQKASFLKGIAPQAFSAVKGAIETFMRNTKSPVRKQFVFYYNNPFGPIAIFDIAYDLNNKKFQIICASNAKLELFYVFLKELSLTLKETQIPFEILACKINELENNKASAIYAYVLTNEISKKSFSELKQRTIEQPYFVSSSDLKPHQFEVLDSVSWFEFSELGDKSILLSSKPDCLRLFSNIYDKTEAELKFETYQKRYRLNNKSVFDEDSFYCNHLYHKISSHKERDLVRRCEALTLEDLFGDWKTQGVSLDDVGITGPAISVAPQSSLNAKKKRASKNKTSQPSNNENTPIPISQGKSFFNGLDLHNNKSSQKNHMNGLFDFGDTFVHQKMKSHF